MGSPKGDRGTSQKPKQDTLAARIEAAQRKHAKPEAQDAPPVSKQAMRAGLDLVAGTLVGFVLGLAVDKALGTEPFGFIALLLLGIVAGFRNSFREVRRMQRAAKDSDRT